MFGKAATEELEVTALEEGRTYTVKAGGGGADYTSVWSVESDSDQTTLTMTFSAETTGLVANVMALTLGEVFEGATRGPWRRILTTSSLDWPTRYPRRGRQPGPDDLTRRC